MAESLQQRLRHAANRVLHPLGLHLARRARAFEMDDLLARAARHVPGVRTWIDVGASDGSWSRRVRRHFPAARFVLFEPLAERQAALAALRARHGFEIVAAVAGAAAGEVEFVVDPALDGSGVAAAGETRAHATRRVPVETIDAVARARALPAPYALKLDTHGYELPVLEGAARVLAEAELLVIEAYNFPLHAGCLRFPQLCAWLEARGFRCADLADPMRRPGDGALWQMDLAFLRAGHAVFASNRYAPPRG
jgi:FkbM family methyltransferase